VTGHPDPLRIDVLPEAERREALEHLRRCEACRRAAMAGDPTRLFSLLAARPLPRNVLDRVATGVSAAVRGGEFVPVHLPSPRVRMVSAWAAAALLAAALLLPMAGGERRPGHEDATAVLAPAALPRAGVQVVSSPGVSQVVDLTVGETQLVMIFDPGLDL
jgi:hypothetical protein